MTDPSPPLSASLRHRLRRRRVYRYAIPVVHPAEARWRAAAFGGHQCHPFVITASGELVAAEWGRG